MLKNGAQCNATSVHGKTPLNIATDPAIIEVLRLHSDATGAGASPVAGGFLAGDARSHLPYTGSKMINYILISDGFPSIYSSVYMYKISHLVGHATLWWLATLLSELVVVP